MKFIKIGKDGSIALPKEILKTFPVFSELALWWKGNSLVLKKVTPSKPTEFAERSPEKSPSLEEVSKETHNSRIEG